MLAKKIVKPMAEVVSATVLMAAAVCSAAPENSSLFGKFRDPVSGVESFVLKPGLLGHNQQSLYFTAKSMTDDGRFLVFDVSDREDPKKDRPPAGYIFNTRLRRKGVVDFEKDRAFILEGVPGQIPHLDRVNDCLYWVDYEAVHRRDLKGNPQADVIVCRIPRELRSKYLDVDQRIATHLTINRDLTKAFLDIRNDEGLSTPGTLDFRTGKFTPWAHFRFYCNHGQFSPVSDHVALCAREFAHLKIFDELTDAERKTARCCVPVLMPNVSTVRRPAGFGGIGCPRIRLLRDDGTNRIIDSKGGCHETFTDDGNGVLYCSGVDGVVLHDLRTDKSTVILPIGKVRPINKVKVIPSHADLSPDGRFVVYDACVERGSFWRGCTFLVGLYDRQFGKNYWLCSPRPAYSPRGQSSFLHPDPHPQFVCNGRYIVYTMAGEPWRMDVCVTPVAQFLRPQEAPASGR